MVVPPEFSKKSRNRHGVTSLSAGCPPQRIGNCNIHRKPSIKSVNYFLTKNLIFQFVYIIISIINNIIWIIYY